MMNIPPDQAKDMSLQEYEARLFHWNEAHDFNGDGDTPDPEVVRPLRQPLASGQWQPPAPCSVGFSRPSAASASP
jgi:hypothetical protein